MKTQQKNTRSIKIEFKKPFSAPHFQALKRTLEIERKDRAELARRALELIKSAKTKWETSERTKVEALRLEIEQQKDKIAQLTTTNNMLNEQLQRAFKLENKHKESLEAVEQMNRRSLVGLESRLEKVAVESRGKISTLQTMLDRSNDEKRALEEEIQKQKDELDALMKKLEKSSEEYSVLNGAALEAEKLVKELSEKVATFEDEMEDNKTLKETVEEFFKESEIQRKKIKDLELANTLLTKELRHMDEYRKYIDLLKGIKTENEKKIHELESKLQEEEQKSASFQKQLVDSETLVNESQQLKELRMNMWKMEKELGNTKIDKRIAERELKDAMKEAKELSEEIQTLKIKIDENRKVHESAMLELNNINESLSIDLVKARESLKNFEDKLEHEKTKNGEEKALIEHLKETMKEKDARIATLTSEAKSLRNDLSSLKIQITKTEEQKQQILYECRRSRDDKQKLIDEVKDTKTQLENHQRSLEALREACLIIENQVIGYEKINASIQAEKAKLAQNTEELIKDLCKAKEEIQEAKKSANEEKSLRLLTETKVKRLSEDMESLQTECDSYKDHCLKYKECSNTLSEELTVSEEKVSDLEVTVKSYERQIEDFVSENNLLKEEISQYLTQIAGLKESNFKLKQQVQDLKNAKNLLIERSEELENILNARVTYFEEREIKHVSTIKQQTKLIDYLQVKVSFHCWNSGFFIEQPQIDEHTHKKKTLTDKLFGHSKKENQPIILPINYKDLESELQKHKKMNKDLQEEIYKLKAEISCKVTPVTKLLRHKSEITSPKTKLAMEQLTKSPASSNEFVKKNSMQRMHHNIPHRY